VRNYWGYLGDRDGETLRETFNRALTNNSALVQIVTWNDFGEGTTIEPTKEYGFRDLCLIQDYAARSLTLNVLCAPIAWHPSSGFTISAATLPPTLCWL